MKTISLVLHRIILLSLAFSVIYMSPLTGAQEAVKQHYVVETIDDEPIAELSVIGMVPTGDQLRARILWKDGSNRLLVIRRESNRSSGAGLSSFTIPSTGETLCFEWASTDSPITMRLETASFDFEEDDEESTTVRQQASSLMTNASDDLVDALESLTSQGFQYVGEFDSEATSLFNILFYTTISPQPQTVVQVTQDVDSDFDPLVDPPSTFEAQFGDHYFE